MRASAKIEFLIDTGAEISIIHPRDVDAAGLDTAVFGSQPQRTGIGIGGTAEHLSDAALAEFVHHDGDVFTYALDVRIAVPTAYNASYPSLLGMDFLRYFRLVVDHAEGVVELH